MLDALGVAAQSVVVIAFFAFLAERLTERLVKPAVPEKYRDMTGKYVTLGLGVLAAVGFRLDIINSLLAAGGLGDPLNEWVSIVTTGLIVGGGSQLVHDLWPGSTAKTNSIVAGWTEWAEEDPETELINRTD